VTRPLATLTAEEVIGIHEALVTDFATSHDPISPSGVRSMDLLESAVSRQWVSHDGRLKYPDPLSNAATLAFGLCCDHPFHNGNKRSALVAMLAHLDRNGLCLQGVSQNDLYQFFLSIAGHTITTWSHFVREERRRPSQRRTDTEVAAIAHWLKKGVQEIKRGDRPIPFRTLRQILPRFGYEFGTVTSNKVEVLQVVVEKPTLLRRHPRETRRRIGSIGYCDEGSDVSLKDLKDLRRMCRLTEEDGVDSDAFYTGAAVVDSFVNRYRTLLRRLART
jgi:death-on-curing protein